MGSEYPNMELRCRMNLVKCQRFKTLQMELPNKNYPFCKYESSSIHRLQLMTGESEDKTIQTNDEPLPVKKERDQKTVKDDVIEEDVIEDEKQEEIPKEMKALTGVFRDEQRRIDMVLVVHDDPSSKTDRVKLDFFTNILRTGLEIEIEPGVMDVHKHLAFIKIHAPDPVLTEYGNLFAIKRYFVRNRLDFAGNETIAGKIRSIFMFRFWKNQEKEWLKIMRSNYTTPGGYSNYERSLVVYKILRHLPFGDHVNQYGLHRLLKRNIVLAAYALHDGPYFAVPNQTASGANGRQFLYYNWSGLHNIFQSQPLQLIHEYFGPKIAFYYTFYEFYNAALALASVAGVVSILMRYIDRKEPDTIKMLICKGRKPDMCPECEMRNWIKPMYARCYMRPMTDYCGSAAANVHLDHPYVPYFCIFMMLWAITFIALWRKKEYVLNWMWEVDGLHSYYRSSTRPEYKLDYQHPRRSTRTGLKYDESGYHKIARIALWIIPPLVCMVASLAIMDECKHLYDRFADSFLTKEKKPKTRDYIVLAVFQTLYTLFISVIEMIYHRLCYWLVDFENHKSYEIYEKSLIKKQFEVSITLMYSFICYYGWTVGRQLLFRSRCQWLHFLPHRTFLFHIKSWIRIPWFVDIDTSGPDCKKYCFPFTCIIELSILLIVMLVLKQVVFRIVFSIYRMVTDYNEARDVNANSPCWEREYKLKEFSEATLTRNYMILAIQFSLIAFFVIAFPLAPLIVLIINVWDMRQSARQLLLASRRALLIRRPGIGAWYNVFVFVAYAAIATNVITLVFATRLALREHFASTNRDVKTILDFTLYDPPLKSGFGEYGHMKCTQPILRRLSSDIPKNYDGYHILGIIPDPGETLALDYFILFLIELKLLVLYGVGMLCCALFIQYYLLKPYRRDVETTRTIENKIKNLYFHYNIVDSKK